MPSSSRHNSKHAKKPKKQPAEKWYIIKDILQERKRGADIEYLVDWEDDPDTGERYRPTWTPSKDVTSKAIFDWRKKLDTLYREDHTTHPEESGAQNEDAFTHTPAVESLDSSQPIQSPRKRKRPQTSQSDDSQLWNSEENLNPPKRGRLLSEAPSTLSSDSFAHTDAASDVLYNNSTFFVAIPSKVEQDFSEYISVSDSQGSTALGSQPISVLEDEDSQVLITENLSQRTIPDSQDYSAFGTQDLHEFSNQLASSTSNKASAKTDREIPDSQKQSSLSKTTDSQTPLLGLPDHHSPFFAHRTPLQSPSRSSQNRQQDSVSSGYIPLTQNSPDQSREPIFGETLATSSEHQQPTGLALESQLQSQSRSQLASHPATQLPSQSQATRNRNPSLTSVSDRSIPSHQIDDLTTEYRPEHSTNRSLGVYCRQGLPAVGTPVFQTQPSFDFDIPSSQTSSSSNGAPASNSSPLAGIENERAAEQIIACSDTQNARSQNTQLAQVVAPLPDISASQIGLSSSSAEDRVIPDTIRRKPSRKQRLNTGPTSSGSSRPDNSDAGISSRQLNRSSAIPQRDEDEDEHSENDSFQTCFESRSPPNLSSPYNSQDGGRRNQPIAPPFTMDASSDEPLSAIEELMRIQEAALQGTLTEGGLTSPTTVLVQHHEDDPAITDAADQAFSGSMHIHSQPPISSDWMGEPVTSSTEMPALSSVPSGPAIEAPVDDAPRTASMGDIFPGNLMPPESADQLPTTISPSDISRSIEPDLSLSGLQHDDQPLELLPEDDTTAGGKSTVTSPDVEEPYLSAPPAAVDQNEYLVTVSFPANIRPLYLSTMTAYKREIEQFNLALQSDEGLPDKATVEAVGRLFDQLRNICDMPVTLDGPSIDALSAVELKKHAMGTNSKFFFVGRFLERLQTSHKKILIVVRDINIVGYLEAVVGTGDMAYSLKGLHELESREEHSLLVVLVYSEQPLVDDLSDFDVVIGFDNGILQTDILGRWAEMSGKKPMLIRLMTTCSIEHLELMMPAELEGLERQNALLIALFQARALVANDEQGEMIDNFASLLANQAIDPDPGFGWEPELIPSNVLDFYSSTQSHNQIPPSAEELSTRKRKADDGSQQVVKRLRVSRSPEQVSGDIDAAVHSHLNPDPSRVHVQTTQGYLDSLSTKISELEHQLEEKTALEINLRKHITNLAKRVKSHDKTINLIQERHMAALRERSQFESLRDDAQQNEGKAWEETHVWQDKAKTLEEELKKKSAILEEALINAGTVAIETFKEKTAELEKALGKIAELEKKLESRDGELGYARDAYQTANHANSELTRENRELKEQVELLRKSAVGSLAQVQNVNAGEQVKEMQRQIAETQAISKDREKELARIEKELRALKNGRRETRQQSVPRSPRLGMMSPRTGRAAGGSASRGTSPTPHESTGSTPAAGLQFFNTPANGRWGHLRD
ncbi:Putative chromo/chromo shadow domain, Chromo-like domain superfamily protein [Colletotrichum destructivum]|uniref:Chromo/chromo shadow domain, Chromo-like domain superfamily protein n=1 Tax=Colletotrichum destructivum TaxID=34406 RepID=A0AAX4I8N8_9PEZI|nr:Putative chromo/chromo shadow domain, Chromo-like domain superfamily protein [Colletotrichum destructivum]